jgi:hypothetical protein
VSLSTVHQLIFLLFVGFSTKSLSCFIERLLLELIFRVKLKKGYGRGRSLVDVIEEVFGLSYRAGSFFPQQRIAKRVSIDFAFQQIDVFLPQESGGL